VSDASIDIDHTPPTTSVVPAKALITRWMRDCATVHQNSCCAFVASWLPTRLIDLGLRTDDLCPSLVVAKGLPQANVPYIALSHSLIDELQGLISANMDRWCQEFTINEFVYSSSLLAWQLRGWAFATCGTSRVRGPRPEG
jgi:hypothetical protein